MLTGMIAAVLPPGQIERLDVRRLHTSTSTLQRVTLQARRMTWNGMVTKTERKTGHFGTLSIRSRQMSNGYSCKDTHRYGSLGVI